jgi:hypothetical protein
MPLGWGFFLLVRHLSMTAYAPFGNNPTAFCIPAPDAASIGCDELTEAEIRKSI